MSYTKEQIQQIEQLHNRGLMPDNIYYQINGKSLQENYMDILMKREQQFIREREQQLYINNYIDKYIDKYIYDKLSECIEKALYDIFNNFNTK